MNLIGWNALLFASKWILIGLIYVALFMILAAVRREMGQRLAAVQSAAPASPGSLRVIAAAPGSNLAMGALLKLRPETTFGTGKDNDIVLRDQYVSTHHARLQWDGVDWWVEDLGSRNGTYLNQNRCPANTPQVMRSGAILRMGEMAFEFFE